MIGAKFETCLCGASTRSKPKKLGGGGENEERNERSTAVTPALTQPPARKPIRILLVEHRTNDAHLIRVLLGAETHYALTIAPQLARGISYLVKDKFDLVLLDLSLPDCPVWKPCAMSGMQRTQPRLSCFTTDMTSNWRPEPFKRARKTIS